MARTCILRAFGLQILCRVSLVLRLLLKKNMNASRPFEHPSVRGGGECLDLFYVCFVSFSSFCFHSSRGLSFICSSICMRPDSHSQLPTTVCVLFRFCFFHFLFGFFGCVAFSEYFCTITFLSLNGEYVVRFSLPGVFYTMWLRANFLHQPMCRNSINESII